MKLYQDNLIGERTSPEFEKELFFVPLGLVLLEIEECSHVEHEDISRQGWTTRTRKTNYGASLTNWSDPK